MIFIFLNLLVILANALVIKGECQCGIFLMDESGNSGTNEVYLSTTHPQACDRLELDQLCRDFCYQKFVNLTANGDLQSISPVFNMSSGEMFCENLRQNVDHREVGGYYRWCQASWKFVGIKSLDSLCCTNSSFVRCEDEKSQLPTSTEPSQSETDQTEVSQEIASDKPDDSANETSPKSSLRNKRNLVEIIQFPRKFSAKSNSAGPKILSKLTAPRSRRTASDPLLAALNSNTLEEIDTNATEEATEENQNWSPQINSTDWIPVQYLPNGMVEVVKGTRPKREMANGQVTSTVHLTSEVLAAINGSAEDAIKSTLVDVAIDDKASKPSDLEEEMSLKWVATVRIDQLEEMTTARPISNDTELQLRHHLPNHTFSEFDDLVIHLNETSTEVTEFVKFNEEKNSTHA